MPYRIPADDEDAKQDAAEVAAFGQGLERRRRTALVIAFFVGILILGAMATASAALFRSTQRAAAPAPTCHEVYVISPEYGTKRVCSEWGTTPPSP